MINYQNPEKQKKYGRKKPKEFQSFFSVAVFLVFLAYLSEPAFSSDVYSSVAPHSTSSPLKKSKDIKPKYESCKDIDLSSALEEVIKKDKDATEAKGSCLSCSIKDGIRGVFGFSKVSEANRIVQSSAFKKKLKKRVIGQIESKVFQTKLVRACFDKNTVWFQERGIEHSKMKELCVQSKFLKSSVKKNWSDMRVQLSLTSPAIRDERFLLDRSTWFDSKPSHLVSDFNSLPKLTEEEKDKAEQIYADTLAKTPLTGIRAFDFQKIMWSKKRQLGWSKKLTEKDKYQLRKATYSLQKSARESYFNKISELPVMAYLKTGNPSDKDMNEAFLKIEENLQSTLKKIKSKDVDVGLLLSFNPLVEELLAENKGYCSVAEQARIIADEDKKITNYTLMGAGVLAALPCFFTGPVGSSICLGGGMALGAVGYNMAKEARSESLGRALTGKEFEHVATLSAKDKEVFFSLALLPLAAWGSTAAPLRTAGHVIKQAKQKITALKPEEVRRTRSILEEQDIFAHRESIKQGIKKNREFLSRQGISISEKSSPAEVALVVDAVRGMKVKGVGFQEIQRTIASAYKSCKIK